MTSLSYEKRLQELGRIYVSPVEVLHSTQFLPNVLEELEGNPWLVVNPILMLRQLWKCNWGTIFAFCQLQPCRKKCGLGVEQLFCAQWIPRFDLWNGQLKGSRDVGDLDLKPWRTTDYQYTTGLMAYIWDVASL